MVLLSASKAEAQPSFEAFIAFKLTDSNNEVINDKTFDEQYQLLNLFGRQVEQCGEHEYFSCLYYDKDSQYFFYEINTIGSVYSFALKKGDEIMEIYLPFYSENIRCDLPYALPNFEFIPGKYLFDFYKPSDSVELGYGSQYFALINKINWKRQKRKFKKSRYANMKLPYSDR